MPRVTQHKISYLTEEQIAKLLDVVTGTRDTAIWTVAYWRGLRASEVGMLQIEDWKPESGRLYVRRLKGSNSGEYKLSPAEIKALRAWVGVRGVTTPGPLFPSDLGRPISRQRLHNLMKEFCRLAGIKPPVDHFHVLRHSIAVHLANEGVDVAVIQDWLGHRDISSTMVYVRITNSNRDRAADLMYAARAPEPPPAPQGKRLSTAGTKLKRK